MKRAPSNDDESPFLSKIHADFEKRQQKLRIIEEIKRREQSTFIRSKMKALKDVLEKGKQSVGLIPEYVASKEVKERFIALARNLAVRGISSEMGRVAREEWTVAKL